MRKKRDTYQQSLALHAKRQGKLAVVSKFPLRNAKDLSLAYTPGVAEPCKRIARRPEDVWKYTIKANTVCVLSDGSKVLGLGRLGAHAAIPVMEGKCALFKRFGDIDAWPICVQSQKPEDIVMIARNIAPVFGAINLEDIAAPACFAVEEALQDLGIPVMHDDQHGTAIVILAALINAAKAVRKPLAELTVVISGAGAAGTATAKLLSCIGQEKTCTPVKDIIICDKAGIIHKGREERMDGYKRQLAALTNKLHRAGSLADAMTGADVFIGVSAPGLVTPAMVRSMAPRQIVFALANPEPEIMPEEAQKAGAAVVATGRSDYPNQVNNVLAFPGVFRGAMDARAGRITNQMKLAAAMALANAVKKPTARRIIPSPFDPGVHARVAAAVRQAARRGSVA